MSSCGTRIHSFLPVRKQAKWRVIKGAWRSLAGKALARPDRLKKVMAKAKKDGLGKARRTVPGMDTSGGDGTESEPSKEASDRNGHYMRTSRVLILGPTPPPFYGVAVATHSIVNSSLRNDFELLHLDTSDRRSKLNFGKLDFPNLWCAVKHTFQLIWILITRRPKIVYIPISQGALGYLRDALFIFLSAFAKARIVLHLRGAYFRTFYQKSNALVRWVIRLSLLRSDRMIVLGECLRPLFDGLLPPAIIRVVPNGVDPKEFPFAMPNRGTDKVKLCYLGNLFRTKGYFDVLEALTRLKSRDCVECTFAGEWGNPQEQEQTLEFVKTRSLEHVVKFVGVLRSEQKKRLLYSSDIFVFPSYFEYEGHPWVIIEAMACGLPVISTNHACIPETVVDGQTGFIVPKNDIARLTERIEQLIANPTLRVAMGRSGRERIEKKFSKEHFIQGLKDVFQELDKQFQRRRED